MYIPRSFDELEIDSTEAAIFTALFTADLSPAAVGWKWYRRFHPHMFGLRLKQLVERVVSQFVTINSK